MKIHLEFEPGVTGAEIIRRVVDVFGQDASVQFTGLTNSDEPSGHVNTHYQEPRSGQAIVNAALGAPAFDSTGLPWDERIHSSSKERNQNGTWRQARNLLKNKGQAYIDSVEAELLAALAGTSAGPAVESESSEVHSPAHTMTQPETRIAPPPSEAASIPPAPTPAALPPSGVPTYMDFVMWASEQIGAGRITTENVNMICAQYGAVDGNNAGSIQMLAAPEHTAKIVGVKAMMELMMGSK